MATTHSVISSTESTMVSKSTQQTLHAPKTEANSAELSWSSVSMADGNGDTSDDESTPTSSSSTPNCSSSNTVHVTFTPLNSPLNTPYSVQPSQFGTLNMASTSDGSRTLASQPATILFTSTPVRTTSNHDSKRSSGCNIANSLGLSKREANLQVS